MSPCHSVQEMISWPADGERRDLMNRNRGPLRSLSDLPPRSLMVARPVLRPWQSGCDPPTDKQE